MLRVFWMIGWLAAGCGPAVALAGKPVVVATTSLVGDVVRSVAGDTVELQVLMPAGTDPHHFEPTARELAAASRADIIFMNGLGLEILIERHLAGLDAPPSGTRTIVSVSDDLTPICLGDHDHDHAHHHHEGQHDPHVWTDPRNVMVWVDAIHDTLAERMPDQAAVLHANAEAYRIQLEELDAWIETEVSRLPPERRRFVADHNMLGYFANRYGLEQAGMILPSFSTAAEPSARELARLSTAIREQGVRALIVGESAHTALADRLAQDAGMRIGTIYSGTLGPAGSGADTYLGYMQNNTRIILDALNPAGNDRP